MIARLAGVVARRSGTVIGITLAAALAGSTRASAQAPRALDPTAYAQLRWRHIGPNGNRVIAVTGVPGQPYTYYAGAASGGLFKTTDGGGRWDPITDSLDVSSISAIAVAPSDPNVVWIGTGETFIRSNISIGNGVYRSTDGGKSWTPMGLAATGRVGRILIDPRDPNVVHVAALGHAYGPQQERGVYRTRDGGRTWTRVLFVDENTGASDIALDPSNPDVLLAGMWTMLIRPWASTSGGPNDGVYLSRDGGTSWQRLTSGLPRETMGKVAVAIARTNPNRMYALIETKDPGLYRSDDAGRTWRLVNQDHDFMERPHYYTRFAVAPDDENRLYFVNVRFSWSLDGGLTKAPDAPRAGGDLHDIWIDPTDARRMMVGDDAGVNISVNGGRTWRRAVLPNAQMYHVAVDDEIPYNVYGNRQDGYSYRGPSNTRESSGSIPTTVWQAVGGCESGFTYPDPTDSNIAWSGCYDGGLERYDHRTRQARAVEVWPEAAYGAAPKDVPYRWNWTFPIAISPHDHNTVYVGSQYVHRTTDGGQSWTRISPDLTRNEKDKQESSGGLVIDNLMVHQANVVFAIAESPKARGTIWAGTFDGLVHLTRDGGQTWTNVTPKGVAPYAAISNIEPSRFDAGTAYLSVDAHQMDDRRPYIYRTTDSGKSWTLVSGGIPASVFSYVHVVREDPVRRGMLYAGTENGVYFTLDDGATWMPLQSNLPRVPVSWITVQERFNDLVISTYGRGFWILDDITPLRELDRVAAGHGARDGSAALLPVSPAYRFRRLQTTISHPDGNADGRNPPYGAAITYYIPARIASRATPPARPDSAARTDSTQRPDSSARSTSADSLTLTILDAQGAVVRVLRNQPARAGLNRVTWDLRYDAPRAAKLRVSPPGHEHARVPDAVGWRPLVTWDLDIVGGQIGPLVAPGRYTVRLSYRGETETQPLVVLRDPHSAGSDEDIRAQLGTALALRSEMDSVVVMIERMEWVRKQLKDLAFQVSERAKDVRDFAARRGGRTDALGVADADSVVAAAKGLERRAIAVEGRLFDVSLTGAREDAFRSPMQLYEKLASLASDVGASSADFRPTDAQLEVHALLQRQLAELSTLVASFLTGDVTEFNRRMASRGVPQIMTTLPAPTTAM